MFVLYSTGAGRADVNGLYKLATASAAEALAGPKPTPTFIKDTRHQLYYLVATGNSPTRGSRLCTTLRPIRTAVVRRYQSSRGRARCLIPK